MFLKLFIFLAIQFNLNSFACMTNKVQVWSKDKIIRNFISNTKRSPDSIVKFSNGHPDPLFESELGNYLLKYKTGKNQKKIVLSIPSMIEKGSYNPFGDGQTNSKMHFGPYWKEKDFPVVGVQTVRGNNKLRRKYIFHASLKIKTYKELEMGSGWFKVTPEGWNDSFYFNFETGILPLNKFTSAIPEKYRTFSENRIAPDPEKLGVGSGLKRFLDKQWGSGYNKEAWYADNVHGLFPDQNGKKTAVGGVLTWGVTDKAFGPFKHLYTCFESRNIEKEKNEGVPSGAGWHHIGDPAETLINSLEVAAIPAAIAKSHSYGDSAYKLSQTISATWLQSEEAFVAQKGEFHWYLNPYNTEVCTEIWVHNCVPNLNNNWGFNCK